MDKKLEEKRMENCRKKTRYNQLDIEWKWVKGHAGVEYNEICDQLCKMEMEKFQN